MLRQLGDEVRDTRCRPRRRASRLAPPAVGLERSLPRAVGPVKSVSSRNPVLRRPPRAAPLRAWKLPRLAPPVVRESALNNGSEQAELGIIVTASARLFSNATYENNTKRKQNQSRIHTSACRKNLLWKTLVCADKLRSTQACSDVLWNMLVCAVHPDPDAVPDCAGCSARLGAATAANWR